MILNFATKGPLTVLSSHVLDPFIVVGSVTPHLGLCASAVAPMGFSLVVAAVGREAAVSRVCVSLVV